MKLPNFIEPIEVQEDDYENEKNIPRVDPIYRNTILKNYISDNVPDWVLK